MIINTKDHISDLASSVYIDANKTFGVSENLQDAINGLHKRVFYGEENATTTEYGTAKLSNGLAISTDILTQEVFDDVIFSDMATTSKYGRVVMEHPKMVENGFVGSKRAVNPDTLNHFISNNTPTNTSQGFVKLVDNYGLESNNNDGVGVTVMNAHHGVTYMIPKMGIASISTTGEVKIATRSESENGSFGGPSVISPKLFHDLKSTTTLTGIVKLSSDSQFKSFENDVATTSKNMKYLNDIVISDQNKMNGIRKLLSDLNNKRIGNVTNKINEYIKTKSINTLRNYVRIGDVQYSLAPRRNDHIFINPIGQYLSKADYPELYSVLGNKYGSNATQFRVPDLRGFYVRSVGLSRFITTHRAYRHESSWISFIPPTLGNVQPHMIVRHKHGDMWSDQSKWGSSFGHTGNRGWRGSRGERWGCNAQYTTDGKKIVKSGYTDYPNGGGEIDDGNENRPWTFVTNIYMRAK